MRLDFNAVFECGKNPFDKLNANLSRCNAGGKQADCAFHLLRCDGNALGEAGHDVPAENNVVLKEVLVLLAV